MQEFHHSDPDKLPDLDLEALDDDLDDLDFVDDEEYATDAAAIADLFNELVATDSPSDAVIVAAEPVEPSPVVPEAPTQPPEPSQQRPQGYLGSPRLTGEIRGSYLSQSNPANPAQFIDVPSRRSDRRWWQSMRDALASGPVLGLSLVAVLAALAFWAQPGRWGLSNLSRSETASRVTVDPKHLQGMETAVLTEQAGQWFREGNSQSGQQAVTELLERSALAEAEAVLAAVPPQQAEAAHLRFLKGRLAWQLIQQGNAKYRLEDVQLNWETAVRQQPTYPTYYNALGLVYYAQGKLRQADRAWFQALYLLEESQVTKSVSSGSEANSKALLPGFAGKQQIRSGALTPEMLTAYAGLTLVLMKTASQQPAPKQGELLNRAARLHEKVMVEDATSFQPRVLQQNWMWTRQMIQDWQAVARQKPKP